MTEIWLPVGNLCNHFTGFDSARFQTSSCSPGPGSWEALQTNPCLKRNLNGFPLCPLQVRSQVHHGKFLPFSSKSFNRRVLPAKTWYNKYSRLQRVELQGHWDVLQPLGPTTAARPKSMPHPRIPCRCCRWPHSCEPATASAVEHSWRWLLYYIYTYVCIHVYCIW